MRADFRKYGLVDCLDVLDPMGHGLSLRDELPSLRGLNGDGVARLE